MIGRIFAMMVVAALVVAVPTVPGQAQAQQATTPDKSSTAAGKTPTPQQQKMKDCAAKWKDEKAQQHVSGQAAYRAFMKQCLKS